VLIAAINFFYHILARMVLCCELCEISWTD